jgi:hypothetical protein
MIGPPIPPNGAVHSLHRGSVGIALNTLRPSLIYGSPSSRYWRQYSSLGGTLDDSVTAAPSRPYQYPPH